MFRLLRDLHQVHYNYMHLSERHLYMYMMVADNTVLPLMVYGITSYGSTVLPATIIYI